MMNKITYVFMMTALLMALSCSSDDDSSSCFDGVQNGDETGIDCGANCGPCISCTDGIQNGNETGVDCGGDCDDCPTCNDGLQNGSETGIDCGGDCDPCSNLNEEILGLWEITSFSYQGQDAFELFQFEKIYYRFKPNNQFEAFNHRTNGQNNLSIGLYSVENSTSTCSITLGNLTDIYELRFSNGGDQFKLIEHSADIEMSGQIISDNLCQGVDCNSGACIYGYCNCPQNVYGENCEVTYGPGGGIVFYDKGSYSNGWRYIEVYPELQNELPISCNNAKSEYGTDGFGEGAHNTIKLSILCSNVNGHAANTALSLNLNGFDDWYIPTRLELAEIYKFNEYLLEYPTENTYYDIHNSLFNLGDHYWMRFRKNTYEGNVSTVNLARKYFVIRYF